MEEEVEVIESSRQGSSATAACLPWPGCSVCKTGWTLATSHPIFPDPFALLIFLLSDE